MRSSLLKYVLVACVLTGSLAGCASVNSGRVSPARHPNLAAAQDFIERALDRISAAQSAHDFDLGGHAAKAKSLLDDAYSEIKLAALAANANR